MAAERSSDETPLGKPAASRESPGGSGPVLVAVTGLFALIIGVLLRAAVGGQDQTDWNGVVKGVLEGFPIVLIVAGLGVLLWGATLFVRAGRAASDDEVSSPERPPRERSRD